MKEFVDEGARISRSGEVFWFPCFQYTFKKKGHDCKLKRKVRKVRMVMDLRSLDFTCLTNSSTLGTQAGKTYYWHRMVH